MFGRFKIAFNIYLSSFHDFYIFYSKNKNVIAHLWFIIFYILSSSSGAINNGATEKEISETLLQAAVYAGIPAGIEAFRVAEKVLSEIRGTNNKSESK